MAPDEGTEPHRARRHPARIVVLTALVGAAIGLAAGFVFRASAPSVATTTFPVRNDPPAADLEQAATILQSRLRAFGDPDATVTVGSGGLVAVEERPAGADGVPEGQDNLADPARFELRPVLGTIAAGDPGWSTTPVSACTYSTGGDGCPEGIRSACLYGDDTGPCDPEARQGDPAVFLGTDAAIYHLGPAILTNDQIQSAQPAVNGPAASVVLVELTPEGAAALKEASTKHIGGQLAFVIDSEVVSAPSLIAPIDSGRLQIALLPLGSGEFKAEAVSLDTPPLPVLLRAGETRIEHRHAVSLVRILVLVAAGTAIGAGVGLLVARRRGSATPER